MAWSIANTASLGKDFEAHYSNEDLLDKHGHTSVTRTIEFLNDGWMNAEKGYVVIFSGSQQKYFLLYNGERFYLEDVPSITENLTKRTRLPCDSPFGEVRRQGSHARAGVLPQLPLPTSNPVRIMMKDPRKDSAAIGVVAFYFPGYAESWDEECGAGFLGNFWPMAADAIKFRAPCAHDERSFCNAEAAFQALKFWGKATEFQYASGKQAFNIKKRERGNEDFTYGGFGSNWKGMMEVLKQKFARGSDMASQLLKTDDAYFLEHNAAAGRDNIWSNNSDGEGKNWLGLQLMLIRDELNEKAMMPDSWTTWIQYCGLNLADGQDRSRDQLWQSSVRNATTDTLTQLGLPRKR